MYLERVFFAKSAIKLTFDTSERADKTYNKNKHYLTLNNMQKSNNFQQQSGVRIAVVSEEVLNAISEKLDEINNRLDEMRTDGEYPRPSRVLTYSSRAKFEFLTTDEVCQMLGVCKSTLENYKRRGTIPYVKIGNKVRYKRSDIERIMNENTIQK